MTAFMTRSGFEFCWKCAREWQRDTHPDFYSCTLPTDKMAHGSKGQFERFDKQATGHIATFIRLKTLQRALRNHDEDGQPVRSRVKHRRSCSGRW
jgi:hypothetical protein